MPPFKLEALKSNPKDKRIIKTLHCKKEYSRKVKITGWEMDLEHQPVDTNPYNPKCFNLHNSHYERLGTQDETTSFISETRDAFSRGIIRSSALDHDPHKRLVNFYTYDGGTCDDQKATRSCGKVCADYSTTMQSSYEPPYPCEIKRLVMPATGNENKHMTISQQSKFWDDDFVALTKTLQAVKGFRQTSDIPWIAKDANT